MLKNSWVSGAVMPRSGSRSYIIRQHVMRYVFAGKFVEAKSVLDIACGIGYGSSYLMEKGAKNVVGGDISKEVMEYANVHYGKNLEFVRLDVMNLPLPKNTFDIIISFETIEHLQKIECFMKEVLRVLKSNGMFICSTPNIKYSFHPNYHIKEFAQNEFFELMENYFLHVDRFAQSITLKERILEVLKMRLNPLKLLNLALVLISVFHITKVMKTLYTRIARASNIFYSVRDTYKITKDDEKFYGGHSVVKLKNKSYKKLCRIMVALCTYPRTQRASKPQGTI